MTYKITESFVETGQIIEREATAEEIKIFKAREKKFADLDKAKLAQAEAKATQKAALLERLGITEDEARLLLA
jgi:cell fate (sporulation/competence/biofilm development) regulator YmcA (YheA/YmcA/DUF963 family)